MSKYTFKEFQKDYPDDDACLDEIMHQQYGGTEFECPSCHRASKFHRIAKRRAYSCQYCGHHIYPCVGTPFEKSRTPLTSWFFAMYLMTSTRHGVAAKELERQIGCTYKTAWRMAHELRKHMANSDHNRPMSGHVEVDETVIGGRQSRAVKREKGDNKTVVMGIVERGEHGIVRAGPVIDVSMDTLERHIFENVQRGSTVSTDEWVGYNRIKKRGPYTHGRVNHRQKEYVRGIHHVNTLESHWSLFKRAVKGTHVHISQKHMWKYASEFSFRRNWRHSHRGMFNRLVNAFSLPRIAES